MKKYLRQFVACVALLVSFLGITAPSSAQSNNSPFRDDFDSDSLQESWAVIRSDPSHYTLQAQPGFFRVLTQRGILGEEGSAQNLLVRPATGSFIIETRIEFDPRAGQQFAGLLVYENDANAVGVGLIRVAGVRGVFRGVIILNFGDDVPTNTLPPAALYNDTNVDTPTVVYVRLLRSGNQFVAGFSEDGISYRDLGTVTNDLADSVLVGIGAANGDSADCGSDCDSSIPADFDFFTLRGIGEGGEEPPLDSATLDRVEIIGPDAVLVGGETQFEASAIFSDGSHDTITDDCQWSVGPPELGSVDGGRLHASELDSVAQLTLVAKYTHLTSGGTVVKHGAKIVRIETDPAAIRQIPLCGGGVAVTLPILLFTLSLAKSQRRDRNKNVLSRRPNRGK